MSRRISLTFDDAPDDTDTLVATDLLPGHDITASFYHLNNNITEDTDKTVARCLSPDCVIRDHSFAAGGVTYAFY